MENKSIEELKDFKSNINTLFVKSGKVFKRFVIVFILTTIITIINLYLTKLRFSEQVQYDYLYKIILACTLAIPLFMAYIFASERFDLSLPYKICIFSIIVSVSVLYYFYIDMAANDELYIRHLILAIIAILTTLWSGFISKYDDLQFWQFLRVIIVRFFTSIVFTLLLFAGLSLAIWSINVLFLFKINDIVYLRLLIVLFGLVFPWLFLSGVPLIDDSESYYHKKLNFIKFLSKNVLLPLIGIYLVIVYVYFVKILVTFTIPNGWISYISSGLSILCIFFIHLVSPFKNELFHKELVKIINKIAYLLIIPAIFILLAGYIRIKNYGITESRYFLIVWALWLLFYIAFGIIRKSISLRIIFFTVSVFLFVSIIGPYNAIKISEISQKKRLENLLIKKGLLTNGKIKPVDAVYKNNEALEIISIVEYLFNIHGSKSLIEWIPIEKDSLKNVLLNPYNSGYDKSHTFLSYINIERDNNYHGKDTQETGFFNFYSEEKPFIAVKGYDYFIPFNIYESSIESDTLSSMTKWNSIDVKLDNAYLKIILSQTKSEITIYNNIQEIFRINLLSYLNNLDSNYCKHNKINDSDLEIPENLLIIERENDKMKMKFQIKSISGTGLNCNDSLKIKSLESVIMLKVK